MAVTVPGFTPSQRPSGFTRADAITETLHGGFRERWQLAYEEALSQQKTAAAKAEMRMKFADMLGQEVKLFEEQIAKAKASYAEALQKGELEAWKAQRERENAEFRNRASTRIFNAEQQNIAARQYASDLGRAERAERFAQADSDYENHKKQSIQDKDYWDDAVAEQSAGAAGKGISEVLDISLDSYLGNPESGIASNDERLRRAVRRIYQDIDPLNVEPSKGLPNQLVIDKVYGKVKDPETRERILDSIQDELERIDANGPTPNTQTPAGERIGEYTGRSDAFTNARAERSQRGLKKEDFRDKDKSPTSTPGSYKAPVSGVSPESYKGSTSLGESEQAMLNAIAPDEELLDDTIGMYRNAADAARAKQSQYIQGAGDWLSDREIAIDKMRDFYHTRFGSQKARPHALNDQLGRATPYELAELQELARARLAELRGQPLPSPTVGTSPPFNFPTEIPAPAGPLIPAAQMRTKPSDFIKPRSSINPQVLPTPDLRESPVDPLEGIQPPQSEQPLSVPPGRPPIIKEGTPLPGKKAAAPTPASPTGTAKAPSIQDMEANHGRSIIQSISKGRELANQPKKLQRLISTTPVGQTVASSYSIDKKNQVPLQSQIDKLIIAYKNDSVKQTQALEIFFGLRTQEETNKLIKETSNGKA